MSNIRKGQLIVSGQWAKHLKWFGKRWFWRKHRQVEKKTVRRETSSIETERETAS